MYALLLSLCTITREKPRHHNETPTFCSEDLLQPRINKYINVFKNK